MRLWKIQRCGNVQTAHPMRKYLKYTKYGKYNMYVYRTMLSNYHVIPLFYDKNGFD